MHDSIILYEEEKYPEIWKNRAIKGIVGYTALLLIPAFLLILIWIGGVIQNICNWNLVMATVYYLFIAFGIYWWMILRVYWAMHKTYNNLVRVTPNGIEVGKLFRAEIKDIERSIYNISTGTLTIYLKNGKKFKICKDILRISHLGGVVHFSYIEYGKALEKIGVPFEVVRRRGFRVEPIRGREAYREMKHKERYEKWLKSQKNNKNSKTGGVRK